MDVRELPIPFILLDRGGRIAIANAAACTLLHVPASNLIGRDARAFVSGAVQPQELLIAGTRRGAQAASPPSRCEHRRVAVRDIRDTGDGYLLELGPLEPHPAANRGADLAGLPPVSRDTLRRIAHDFNNLLSVVVNYSALLQLDPTLPESARDTLDELGTAGSRATVLARELQALARAHVDPLEVCSLGAELEAAARLGRQVSRDAVRFVVARDQASDTVLIRRTVVERIVMNLALFALEVGSDAQVIELHARGRADAADNSVTVELRVPGVEGSRASVLAALEDESHSLSPRRGLGMPAVVALVEDQGGWVTFEWERPQTLRVSLRLPWCPDWRAQEPAPQRPAADARLDTPPAERAPAAGHATQGSFVDSAPHASARASVSSDHGDPNELEAGVPHVIMVDPRSAELDVALEEFERHGVRAEGSHSLTDAQRRMQDDPRIDALVARVGPGCSPETCLEYPCVDTAAAGVFIAARGDETDGTNRGVPCLSATRVSPRRLTVLHNTATPAQVCQGLRRALAEQPPRSREGADTDAQTGAQTKDRR